MVRPADDPVLRQFRAALVALYDNRLQRAVLFGSRAGGREPGFRLRCGGVPARHAQPLGGMKRLADLSTDLLDETGEFVHAMPYHAETYADARMPLMHEIRREGIDL